MVGPEPREPAEGQGNRPGLALSRRASPPCPPRLSPALTSTEKRALVRGTTGANFRCYSLEITVKRSCTQMSQESNIVTLKCLASCWACMSSGHSLRSQPKVTTAHSPSRPGPVSRKALGHAFHRDCCSVIAPSPGHSCAESQLVQSISGCKLLKNENKHTYPNSIQY